MSGGWWVVCRGVPGMNTVMIGAVPVLCGNAPITPGRTVDRAKAQGRGFKEAPFEGTQSRRSMFGASPRDRSTFVSGLQSKGVARLQGFVFFWGGGGGHWHWQTQGTERILVPQWPSRIRIVGRCAPDFRGAKAAEHATSRFESHRHGCHVPRFAGVCVSRTSTGLSTHVVGVQPLFCAPPPPCASRFPNTKWWPSRT